MDLVERDLVSRAKERRLLILVNICWFFGTDRSFLMRNDNTMIFRLFSFFFFGGEGFTSVGMVGHIDPDGAWNCAESDSNKPVMIYE